MTLSACDSNSAAELVVFVNLSHKLQPPRMVSIHSP